METELILSAAGGASFVAAVAKWAVGRALGDLDKLRLAVAELQTTLAAVAVRLEAIAQHDTILQDHSKKLAFFEGAQCKTLEPR